jgi:DNA polymerase-1
VNNRQRIFLIDGYSNIFRAFYAIRNLSNSRGEPTNAVYGFVQMLRKLLRDENPELLGVALDVSGPTVRDEKFEEYKANRAEMPEDLRTQIPWIRQAIEAHRIPILEMDRYEADDVLGTLAKKASAAGYAVTLVSSDKDLMQLVDENISLYHTGRDKLYDPQGVEEDFGVAPELVTEVLALKGDAVDNIPGVPGIGEKGALQLVRQFGSVEALLERASEVSRKSYREGLQQHREQALLSKELVTIHTDLPIELETEKLQIEEPDLESLRTLYREMGFRRLLEEVEAITGSEEVGSAEEVESVA